MSYRLFNFAFTCLIFFVGLECNAQSDQRLEAVLQKGHSKPITCYSFSPDSSFVVTGSADNSIILWDILTGRQVRVFNRHSEKIYSLSFSPDGKKILSCSADNSAKVFDVLTGELRIHIHPERTYLDHARWSPKGKYIVVADDRDGIFIYDTLKGKLVNSFYRSYSIMNTQDIINADENNILSANDYASFFLCNIITGDTLKQVEFDKAYQLSFSPDGKYIAASSAKLFTQIFDATNGKLIYTLKDGAEECDGCNTKHVFSNSGKFLVTMSDKIDGIVWDMATGKKIKSISTFRERPQSLVFSKDDSHVLLSFDDDVYVYEVKSGKEKLHINQKGLSYYEFTAGPENSFLLSGFSNEAIIYNMHSGKRTQILKGFMNKKRDDGLKFNYNSWSDKHILKYISMRKPLELSPDQKYYAIGGIDSSAMIIEVETGRVKHYLTGHRQTVIAIEYSPDGKLIATAGGDRKIIIWSTETGQKLHTLTGHQELIFDLAFNAEGTELASGSWDGSMRIWDMSDPGEYTYFDLGGVSPYTVAFTQNDLYIVTGDLNKNIDFWEPDAGAIFRTLVGHTGPISGVEFSSDNKYVATSSWDGKVKVWDVLNGMLVSKMDGHEGAVYALAYSPDNTFIASGGADNVIIYWNTELNTKQFLTGHTAPVTSICFNSAGDKLISCDADGMVKVWDLKSMRELYSRIQITKSDWLATSPSGKFDGSSGSLDHVNYVSGMKVVPISSLFDKYYTPDLISKIFSGELKNDSGENLNQNLPDVPLISFEFADAGIRSIENVDSMIEWSASSLPLGIRINSQGEKIEEIRIYNNGKLVIRESMETELEFRGGDKDVRQFEIPLLVGENNISARVINAERVESSPAEITVFHDGTGAQTDLFILSIGINEYKNPQYNLSYAVNDATAFLTALKNGADSLFNSVTTFSILNEQAVKPNISETFTTIINTAGPEDVFVFYYAGHGIMSYEKDPANSDFYIVTHDLTNLYSETTVLKQKAISAVELMEFSKMIRCGKQLFILDACHSGGALDAFASRGDGREKSLAQLARSTGTFFITASQDAQFANEVGNLEHGLFTYALLEILNGQKGNNGDDKITISELKLYVEERVPELSEQYRGSPQFPTSYSFGQDFPIVILK
ncbi:MAG: caspase family protein [Crocinitomicaceae bacterium]|nr:caspase family protein [Crocinitomicaceae bacterium]